MTNIEKLIRLELGVQRRHLANASAKHAAFSLRSFADMDILEAFDFGMAAGHQIAATASVDSIEHILRYPGKSREWEPSSLSSSVPPSP